MYMFQFHDAVVSFAERRVIYMKAYTEFVNQVFTCISSLFPSQEKKWNIFAEGSEDIFSSTPEYAILRNENADMFCSLIRQNAELFGIQSSEYEPVSSPLYPSERKIIHSCYSKNVRRWMQGTISRKKTCRVEFCVLAWCHVQNWNRPIGKEPEEKFLAAKRELLQICNKFLNTQHTQLSIKLLWQASSVTYKDSFFKTET